MKATTYLKNIHRIIPVAFRQYIENSFVDKQRLFIYIYATVGSVLILDINLLGVSGPYGSYFMWLICVICCRFCLSTWVLSRNGCL